tara:strand:- start:9296 stop:9589 length:294 start_codon:yes stop_codon:yes gene_type:complete
MIIYVDIDNTIFKTEGTDYTKSKPMPERIKAINNLYDQGNEIIYWTARGTGSGKDWSEVTKEQFKRYGVKYHTLKFSKPIYDIFIDDKNINSEEFFK